MIPQIIFSNKIHTLSLWQKWFPLYWLHCILCFPSFVVKIQERSIIIFIVVPEVLKQLNQNHTEFCSSKICVGDPRDTKEQQHSFWTSSFLLNMQFIIINLKKLNWLQLLPSNYCDRLHNKTLLVFVLSFSHAVPTQAWVCLTAQSWASDKFRFYKADIEIMDCWHPSNIKWALWDVNPGWQVPVLCWPIWVSSMWDILIDLYILSSIYMGFVSANPWKARPFVCHNLGRQF